MINLSKLAKVAAIGGGVLIFSEVCGIVGEAQAFAGMHNMHPDETDDVLDQIIEHVDDYKDEVPFINRFKAKQVAKFSRWCIDNDIFG